MAQGLQIPVGLNMRGLKAGVKSAQGVLRGLGKGLKMGALVGGAAGLAAAMVGVHKAIAGVKEAFDLGGTLSDVSAQTGIAAGDLEVLRLAFENAGAGADQVGPTVNRLQKALVAAAEGGQKGSKVFRDLGLNVALLQKMSPAQQFEAVAAAFSALPDPAERAAAAIAVFGRSGGKLLALFGDRGALADARNTLGGQADILNRAASQFDRVSDLIGNIGVKLRGIWVGIADKIAPVIQTFLEQLNRVDWSGLGQQLGDTLAKAGEVVIALLEAFKQGQGFALASKLLQLGVAHAVNMLWDGAVRTVKFLAATLPPIFGAVLAKLSDPQFWVGIKNLFQSLADSISIAIRDALGWQTHPAFRTLAEERAKTGILQAATAGNVDLPKVLEEAMTRGIAAATGKGGRPLINTTELRDEVARIVGQLAGPVISRETAGTASPRGPVPPAPAEAAVAAALKPMVTSLARIGGEGGGMLARTGLALDRDRNRTLELIRKEQVATRRAITGGGAALAAAF